MKIKKDLLFLFINLIVFLGTIVYRIFTEYSPLGDMVIFLIATGALLAIIIKLHFTPKE